MKILIVEDEADYAELMAMVLEAPGRAIQTASDGEEAWRLLQRESFQLVLTDLRLPGISGMELLARLRAQRPDLRALFTSGYDDERAGIEGTDGLLPKPASLMELLRAVRRALEQDLED